MGKDPLSAEDVKPLQAEVRRQFVNTLVAEAEQLANLSDEFLSLEQARKNSTKADGKAITEAQKVPLERSMSGWILSQPKSFPILTPPLLICGEPERAAIASCTRTRGQPCSDHGVA